MLYVLVGTVLLILAAARRVSIVRRLISVAVWIACAVVLVGFVDQLTDLDPRLARVASLLHLDRQEVVGQETRIAMAPDGHFWVRASIGGVERRMLVDSGATITTISQRTAAAAGLKPQHTIFPVLLQTANGTVVAQMASVQELRLGNIVARDMSVLVAPSMGGMNVIGMNFLSRLKGWRVEDGMLVLSPHHPQANDGAQPDG